MISQEKPVEMEFDGELYNLVDKKQIDDVEIYKFDTLFKTVYCILENGSYRKIDRSIDKDLSEKINKGYEYGFQSDIIW